MTTVALDLAPLAYDPQRGVARALAQLLGGLAGARGEDVRTLGLWPRRAGDAAALAPEAEPGLTRLEVLDLPAGTPARAARRALVGRAEALGADALLSPWAAFPATRLPVVAWIHEVPFARHGALEGLLRTARHRRALSQAVARAARLVVPSQAVARDLLHLHPEAAPRVQVIFNGFTPGPWEAAVPAADGAAPYVACVGTGAGAAGARKKGLDVLFAAVTAGLLGGLRVVVAGRLEAAPPGVSACPDLCDAALARLVAGARALAVPSRSEGFGYPMLEAFACGVPVVASAGGALPEVSGGAALLVPPGDPRALAEGLRRVTTDLALREQLIGAGRRRAQEFPPEAAARAWLGVLCRAGGSAWRA